MSTRKILRNSSTVASACILPVLPWSLVGARSCWNAYVLILVRVYSYIIVRLCGSQTDRFG